MLAVLVAQFMSALADDALGVKRLLSICLHYSWPRWRLKLFPLACFRPANPALFSDHVGAGCKW
jgi:hypothetical protein